MDAKFVIERQGRQMVLYQGLLNEGHERGLQSIETTIVQLPTEDNDNMAVVSATVTMKDGSVFTDIGDAKPSNVGPNIRGHILRMAATRAKARALRDAVNVGMVFVEELGGEDDHQPANVANQNGRRVDPATGEILDSEAPAPKTNSAWPTIWARWEKLVGDAAAVGVDAIYLTPIHPEMDRAAIAKRIEEVKAEVTSAEVPF